MASPTKNLVDATTASNAAYMCINGVFKAVMPPTINLWYSPSISGINNPTDTGLVNRFALVTVFTNTAKDLPMVNLIIKPREAAIAAIKTFPAIYRERASTRPSEGQIYPRGFWK